MMYEINQKYFNVCINPNLEFKIYSNVQYEDNKAIKGELVIEPVIRHRDISNIELSRIPLYYNKNEGGFVLQDASDYIMAVVGLICYDLGIGAFEASLDTYNHDLHDAIMHDINHELLYTAFEDIYWICLNGDELSLIDNYNFKLHWRTDGFKVKELIKYEQVSPKLNEPKHIKGNYSDGEYCFEEIKEFGW